MQTIFKTNYNPSPENYFIGDEIKRVQIYRAKNPSIGLLLEGSYSAKGKSKFKEEEYDLYEMGRIINTESFVARAFTKKNTLIFRDGYEIKCDSEENLEYIKLRIKEIEFVSQIKFKDLLREYSYNLIAFHNPYIVKVRKLKASSGKVRKFRGKSSINPVAAYFCLPPEAMQKSPDTAGEPTKYREYLSGSKYREFKVRDIIYTPYDKRTGYSMGTPPLEPVKDDILALRRIEESVETLIYKSLFPIIHVQVGTEKVPAKTLPNGVTEVDAAASLLENIDDNGGIVTSDRIKMSSIGAESLALRVESYLDHFKKRVFAGLGMSAMDFGYGDCHDGKTLVLTSSGWMHHSDVDITKVKIGTYNRETKEIEYQKATAEHKYPFSGELINFIGRDTDIMVTENHSMAIRDGRTDDYKLIDISAKELESQPKRRYSFVKTGIVTEADENEEETILELGTKRTSENRFKKIQQLKAPFSTNYEAIMAMFMLGKTGSVKAIIDPDATPVWEFSINMTGFKDEKRRRIIDIFRRSVFNPKEKLSKYKKSSGEVFVLEFKSRPDVDFFYKEIGTKKTTVRGNRLPSLIKGLKLSEKKAIVDFIASMKHWGRDDCSDSLVKIHSRQAAQDIVDLCFEVGRYAYKQPGPETKQTRAHPFTAVRILTRERGTGTSLANIGPNSPPSISTRRVPYTGEVWCYEVPNSLIVTKRSGFISINGNSTGRATGEVLSSSLRDSIVTYQSLMEEMVTEDIFTELLLEKGGYEHPFDIPDEEKVRLVFSTVDTDEKIKKESHVLNMMTQGILMTNEARREIGRVPLEEGQLEELHSVKMKQIDADRAQESAAAMHKLTKNDAPAQGEKSSPTKRKEKQSEGNKKAKGSSNQTKSITSPKNQHSKTKDFCDDLYKTFNSDYSDRIRAVTIAIKLNQIAALEITEGVLDDINLLGEDTIQHIADMSTRMIESLDRNHTESSNKMLITLTLDNIILHCQNIKK